MLHRLLAVLNGGEALRRDCGYEVQGLLLGDREALGAKCGQEVVAVWTGEKRRPKAGEYYFSGAIINAYRAHADLNTAYHIARLVVVPSLEVYEGRYKEAV